MTALSSNPSRHLALAGLLATLFVGGCNTAEPPKTASEIDVECLQVERLHPSEDPQRGFLLEVCGTGENALRRITDRRLRTSIELQQPPQRIVSQSLGSDEMLFELLTSQSLDRLVGVSALSRAPDYSDHIEQAEAIGEFVTDKTEEILALTPDLVFAASYSTRETVRQLQNASVPIVVLHQFSSVRDIVSNVEVTAFALFLDREGQHLIEQVEAQVDRARKQLASVLAGREPRVLAFGSGSVYGLGTTFDDLAEQLGLSNIPGQEQLKGWPTAHGEQLLAWRPELIYLGSSLGSERRVTDRFRRDFPSLFSSSAPPKLVVLPSKLMTTVSHRLGALAESMAGRTAAALEQASANSL